jgi:hypothetical protein
LNPGNPDPSDLPVIAPADRPLGLTVHALPLPSREGPGNAAGRWKMIAVLLVCAAPVVASYFTYYVIRPEGRKSYGELIDPQRPLPALQAHALDGKAVELTSLRGQWLLMSVASATCDAGCQQRLYWQRQLREALGKEKDRLDWIWLVNDGGAVDGRLTPALSSASVLRVNAAELSRWLMPAPGQQLENHLYLIDPLGNWMMRFPANMDAPGAAKAKRDLDRLMRASASWDKEGRQAP